MSLFLDRKKNEAVYVGSTLIRIIKITGERVRIAFDGPPETKIMREEIMNKDSSSSKLMDLSNENA